jgi:putative endonuclease
MQEGKTIVFVEVKARTNDKFGWPEEAVKLSKQQNIIKAAETYLFEKKLDVEIRFDIISILFNPTGHDIYHILDAFAPTQP